MKKLILMLAFAGLFASAYTQTLMVNEVPAVVKKAFARSHTKIDTVQWSKSGDFYKVSYDVNKKDMSSTYTSTGKLKETESEISTAALPTSVLKYINETYPDDVVKQAKKVISAAGKLVYMVKIKGMDLTFNSDGKLIK